MFNTLLDPILSPLLSLDPLVSIPLISFVLTLIITLIYKLVTDQTLMKSLKKELKDLQNEMKKHKDNPTKMMKVQKKAMDKNMQYMMQSLKPTLFTLLPILIVFGWLSSHLAYYPLVPDVPFTVTATFDNDIQGEATINATGLTVVSDKTQKIVNSQAAWTLQGKAGNYIIEVNYADKSYDKELLITTEGEYIEPVKQFRGEPMEQLVVGNAPIKPLPFSILGWEPGWLGTYIIFSILFSILLRKLLDVH